MCKISESTCETTINERRNFLRIAGAGTGALVLASILPGTTAYAATTPAHVPKNKVEPESALARLVAGNTRFVEGVTKRYDFQSERTALVNGQHPFAAILACADSRTAPEYTFDTAIGELFSVRVAGNFVDADGLASLEYAVAMLGTSLILVLGHDSCGAVTASVESLTENTQFPGQIQGLADAIKPSVIKVIDKPGNLLVNAIEQNVKDTVALIKSESDLLAEAVSKGTLHVVGGIYRLNSGKVDLVA